MRRGRRGGDWGSGYGVFVGGRERGIGDGSDLVMPKFRAGS